MGLNVFFYYLWLIRHLLVVETVNMNILICRSQCMKERTCLLLDFLFLLDALVFQ